jgi:hypothetical protein
MLQTGDEFVMHKIKIMDANREQNANDKCSKRDKNYKTIKICDSLFEIGLRKGLIEKNNDEYYFVGDYEELIAFKNE